MYMPAKPAPTITASNAGSSPAVEPRSAMLLWCEERAGDLLPLLIERGRWRGLAGAFVPAAGVHLVAFDAVQIGVRPGALLVGLILGAAMALVPVALGLPPQRLYRAAGTGWRRRAGERGFES